jgi:hypothetical protein
VAAVIIIVQNIDTGVFNIIFIPLKNLKQKKSE